jgi:sarcosine oxidase gamma subunit
MMAKPVQISAAQACKSCELVSFAAAEVSPGAVSHPQYGTARLLHFAPDRWLIPEPSVELLAQLNAQTDVVIVNTDGKWSRVTLQGSGVDRLLSSTIAVDTVLKNRQCAAVVLFGCPTILLRLSKGYEVWVLASYADSFSQTIMSCMQQIFFNDMHGACLH